MRALIYIFILYVYLLNPYFAFMGGVGSIKLLYPLLIVVLFSKNVIKLFIHYKNVFLAFLLIIFYTAFRAVVGGDIIYVSNAVVAMIEVVFLPVIILTIMLNEDDIFINKLLITGSIASIISTLIVLMPGMRSYILDITVTSDYLERVTHRGFGLGEGLTYSYSIILAIIFVIGLFNYRNNKWIAFFSPLFILSIGLNARIGLLILIIGLVILFLTSNLLKSLKKSSIIAAIVIAFISIVDFDSIIGEAQVDFIIQFWLELGDVALGTSEAKYSTANTLVEDMFVLPSNIQEWIIGKGYSIYTGKFRTTDIGFLLQLNYGGIYYMAFLFILVVSIFRNLKWVDNKQLILFLLGVILFANIKGEFLLNSGGFRLISLLVLYYSFFADNNMLGVNKTN